MKKAYILSLASLFLFSSCVYASAAETETTAAEETQAESDFEKYVSNTFLTSGNNMFIEEADGITYRAYFPAEEYGQFEYKFYFSNTVDSTYDKGDLAYGGRSGGGRDSCWV